MLSRLSRLDQARASNSPSGIRSVETGAGAGAEKRTAGDRGPSGKPRHPSGLPLRVRRSTRQGTRRFASPGTAERLESRVRRHHHHAARRQTAAPRGPTAGCPTARPTYLVMPATLCTHAAGPQRRCRGKHLNRKSRAKFKVQRVQIVTTCLRTQIDRMGPHRPHTATNR